MLFIYGLSAVFLAIAVLVALNAWAQARSTADLYSTSQESFNNGTLALSTSNDYSTGVGLANLNIIRGFAQTGQNRLNNINTESRWWAIVLVIIAVVLFLYAHFYSSTYRC